MKIVSDSEIRQLISKVDFSIPLNPTISCAQAEPAAADLSPLANSQNTSQQ
jgi:hypothetical protein